MSSIFRFAYFLCLGFTFTLGGCSSDIDQRPHDQTINILRVDTKDLPGWSLENFHHVAQAFSESCQTYPKRGEKLGLPFPDRTRWQEICQNLPSDPSTWHVFFEENFQAYKIITQDYDQGLLTGYYTPQLRASKTKTQVFKYPVYTRPKNLIEVNLSDFGYDMPNQKLYGKVDGTKLVQYDTRREIDNWEQPHANILAWVDDPIDLFALHIQGSGQLKFPDGSTQMIGYLAKNGREYSAIGRYLIANGAIDKDKMSWQAIRSWLKNNGQQRDQILQKNASYIFFRNLSDKHPIGAMGRPITAMRSLAIDPNYIPYGLPIWMSSEGDNTIDTMQRLVFAQDTGSAIQGPIRGDLYVGTGEKALKLAGKLQHPVEFWVLLPR